ncbi:MAG: aspartate/glutamate racemase family protein [Coprothermobacter sp.]|nr:aspartate/glutamate racemase family protein [Coprothermobacter sp.]
MSGFLKTAAAIIVRVKSYLVYDSGIGGAWFSLELLRRKKAHRVVFYADTLNFPLGLKSETELYNILDQFFSYASVAATKPAEVFDGIFLACNTISSVYLRYWPVFKKKVPFPIVHTYAYHNGLIGLPKPLILATEATVRARIYTYFTAGRGVEMPATDLIEALQQDDTQRAKGLVKQTATFARKERFSHVVLGCTHLSEVAALFEEEGLPVYDPLAQILGNLKLDNDEGFGANTQQLILHATGDYGDVVNYVRRKAALLPEEVLLDAD